MSMKRPTQIEAIKRFLCSEAPADFAERYHKGMEVQIIVGQDGGTLYEAHTFQGRQWQAWEGPEGQRWYPIRIPNKSNTEPEYNLDAEMRYDLAAHAAGIGMTGWNWLDRCSEWVGFDFDAISGHSDRNTKKLTEIELAEIARLAQSVSWIQVRRSTSGKGLHLYAYIDSFPTANHTEHAAIGRAILANLSGIVGFDFQAKADQCGGNMWVWHRKMIDTQGLTVIKEHSGFAPVPDNWRDHLNVVKGSRKKNLPLFVEDQKNENKDAEAIFEKITGQRLIVPLDEDHKRLLDFLRDRNCRAWWDSDHHMLVTHTWHLKEAHDALGFKGVFRTIAQGTERGADHNCFSGDDLVLTSEGAKSFREAIGIQKLYVETDRGFEWIDCEIKSFGIQNTYPMYLGDGSSYHPTANHRWLYRDQNDQKVDHNRVKYTYELVPGKSQLPLAPIQLPAINDDYREGYCHGFIFGDGWEVNPKPFHGPVLAKEHCDVALFKDDVMMENLLLQFGTPGTQYYEEFGHVRMVRNLPSLWKELPRGKSNSYLLGFILGLATADGSVSTNISIFQSDWHVLNQIRKWAIMIGLRVNPIHEYGDGSGFANGKQGYVLRINTYNIDEWHLIRKDQKETFSKRKKFVSTTITAIDWAHPTSEEVFCAVVPHWQNFTLGNGVQTKNCFMFPMAKGSWAVRRYTQNTAEDGIWDTDQSGYKRCYYNRLPDLDAAAKANLGIERTAGGYAFSSVEPAAATVEMLGGSLLIPERVAKDRSIHVKAHREDGKIIVEMENLDGDKDQKAFEELRWALEGKRWKTVIPVRFIPNEEATTLNCDDAIRHIVTPAGNDAGWIIKSEEQWRGEPLKHVQAVLSTEYAGKQITGIIGSLVLRPWTIVALPFQSEYPGDRTWNRNAPQLAFLPAPEKDANAYPTWDRLLRHLGKGLNSAVAEDGWCKANMVYTGADYLKIWVASVIQQPMEQLPYLFFYSSEEDTGKSTFHEAFQMLVTRGVEFADNALINVQGFNGELENSVLCVVEETNLSASKVALNRIKAWVTAKMLPVHPKHGKPYSIPNTTHWIQLSNEINSCPILPGDTRITMIPVVQISLDEMIPKRKLLDLLRKEAPAFLRAVLDLEIPQSNDRLNLPVVTTQEKVQIQVMNETLVETFLREQIHHVPGLMIKVSEMWKLFYEWLDEHERDSWSKIRMGKEIKTATSKYPKGRNPRDAEYYYGNCSLIPWKMGEPKLPELILEGEKLVPIRGAKQA